MILNTLPPVQQGRNAKSPLFGYSSGSIQPKASQSLLGWDPPGTCVLRLHEELKKAESLLAI